MIPKPKWKTHKTSNMDGCNDHEQIHALTTEVFFLIPTKIKANSLINVGH